MSDTSLPPLRIMQYIRQHPWAMEPGAFGAMMEVVQIRVRGVHLTKTEKRGRIDAARRTPGLAMSPAGPGGVAVIPLMGVMAQRIDMFSEMSGGVSTEKFGKEFQEAVSDPNVGGIVINVDSPGGSVFGVQELAAMITAARGPKPIIAVANSLAASAAYWIASCCDELVVVPGGQVGGIGIICCHQDMSKMDEMLGVKMTYITAPEGGYKSEGNTDEPLSKDALDYMQATVNEYYAPFVAAVAAGRKVSAKAVREDFGKGRVVTAARAVELGMADRIATLQEVIDGMVPKKQGSGQARPGKAEGEALDFGAEAKEDPTPPVDLALARARHQLAGARRTA